MNDFDFEELDEAVNALASKTHEEHGGPEPAAPVPVSSGPVSAPLQPALSSPMASPQQAWTALSEPTAETEVAEPSSKPELIATPQKRIRLSDAHPRRGAFMDIVPPTPRKLGIRGSISLQPVSKPEEHRDEKAPPEPEIPDTVELSIPDALLESEPSAKPKPAPAPEKTDDDVAWPDPLDFQREEPKKDDRSEESETPSPFLAEAKVEKRPLGAFSNFRATNEDRPAQGASDSEPTSVVDELTPGENGTFEEPKVMSKPEVKPEKFADAKEKELAPEVPPKPDMHSAAMMSIPQQYRTEAKSTDTATRPVFDIKEYHPPLLEAAVHDHGGGSMWGKLFIALVVLALLGVAAYFTYLYVIQR